MNKKAIMLSSLFCIGATLLVGCGREKGDTSKTIRVQIEKGGYGTSWMDKLKENFEKVYSNEGYKIKILDPHESDAASSDYNALVNNSDVDVFFSSSLLVKRVVNGDFGQLVADLTDEVYGKPAIKTDGTEETKNIITKLEGSNAYYDEQYKYDGKLYNFIYHKSIGGLVYNSQKLASVGYTEAPVTTNQMQDMFHAIHKKFAKGETLYQPLTLVGSSATNGYPNCFVDALVAQYSGNEYWNKVWTLQNEDGSNMTKEQGFTTYQDDSLTEALNVIYELFDSNNTCSGTNTFDVNKAHLYVADANEARRTGGSIFMCDGDWMYNETIKYANVAEQKANNLRFINFPVISALGTKLWGEKTTHGLTAAECEEILVECVKLADKKKTAEEIVSTINDQFTKANITKDEALAVLKARGIYVSRGGETGTGYIREKSTKKDIAYKLLRMYASDDFAEIFHQETNGFTPYAKSYDGTNEKDYFKGYVNIINNPYATGIWSCTRGYRNSFVNMLDLFPKTQAKICHTIYSSGVSGYNESGEMINEAVYRTAATTMAKDEAQYLYDNWDKWAPKN